MTIVTKVGVFYVDHMNDDAPEVNSFSRGCYQALSSPCVLRREPGDEARRIAHTKGITVSYESLSPTSHKKKTQTANKARAKQRACEEDDGEGPPDKRRHLEGIFLRVINIQHTCRVN